LWSSPEWGCCSRSNDKAGDLCAELVEDLVQWRADTVGGPPWPCPSDADRASCRSTRRRSTATTRATEHRVILEGRRDLVGAEAAYRNTLCTSEPESALRPGSARLTRPAEHLAAPFAVMDADQWRCRVCCPVGGRLNGQIGRVSEGAVDIANDVKVVVLTALPLEYKAVRAHLSALQRRSHHAGTEFEIGRLGSGVGRVAIAEIGEGNSGAAALAERAIATFEPDAVLFVGIAGALKDDINLGDIVVGTRVYAYHGGKDEDHAFSARPRAYEASHELEQRARLVARADQWQQSSPRVHFKPIAAGEVVLNSRVTSLALQIRQRYNDAAAIEMESAGVAHAGHLNRALVLTVRGISDRADGQKHLADSAGSQPAAAENAAAFAFDLIDDFLAGKNDARQASSPAAVPHYVTNITAETGGTAFGATHGNVYVYPTERLERVGWRSLGRALEVAWRSDMSGQFGLMERSTLELHLVTVGDVDGVEVRRLPGLAEGLGAIGRSAGLFSSSQALSIDSSDRVARASSDDHRAGPVGLAVDRFGQRSAWEALPHDMLGAVLDANFVADRLRQMLVILSGLDLPAPDRYAPALGIQPLSSVTLGQVNTMPRHQAAMNVSAPPHLRVQAEESLPADDVRRLSREVAEELTARLLAAFRRAVR